MDALAETLGYDRFRVKHLVDLGHALEVRPEVEDLLRRNEIPFPNACVAGRILDESSARLADEDWVEIARTTRNRDLRSMVSGRLECVRRGMRRLVSVRLWVTEKTRGLLDRCRRIASRRKGRPVSASVALDDIVNTYLRKHDPAYIPPGKRRMPPTSLRPWDRKVPADAVRAIFVRSGGICEVGLCPHPIMQLCHVAPHAEGSGREERDLFGACNREHTLYDGHDLELHHWDLDGTPCFQDKHGRLLPRKPKAMAPSDVDAMIERLRLAALADPDEPLDWEGAEEELRADADVKETRRRKALASVPVPRAKTPPPARWAGPNREEVVEFMAPGPSSAEIDRDWYGPDDWSAPCPECEAEDAPESPAEAEATLVFARPSTDRLRRPKAGKGKRPRPSHGHRRTRAPP